MKRILVFITFATLLYGCESNTVQAEKNAPEPNIELENFDETTITPNHIATFEVEGMMCEKGCGSAIRKGLYETRGVSKVDILDFDENDSINKIKVYFDIDITTTEEMIGVIGSLANKRYSAKLRKVTESTISKI